MASVIHAADRAAETAAGAQKVVDMQHTVAVWQLLLLVDASSSAIWPAESVYSSQLQTRSVSLLLRHFSPDPALTLVAGLTAIPVDL